MTGRAALVGLAFAGAVGCEVESAPASTARDSLGVTIVESAAPAWTVDSSWRIEDEPVVDLAESGSSEMHTFFQVRDVLRAGGDRLVVADGASQQIRVYDSAGRFERAFGGPGEGPGEFGFLWGVTLTRAGRLVGTELGMGGRGAEFDLESGLVATFRMPPGARALSHPVPSDVVWGFDDGYTMDDEDLPPGLQRSTATIVRLAEDRMSAHPVAEVPGHEHIVVPEGDAIPLMPRLTHVAPTGGGELVVGTADALEYSIIDGRTGLVRLTARILGISLAVTDDEVEHERQVRLGPDPRPFTRDLMARLPVPTEKPAYQQLVVDLEGNVWAGEFLGLARRDEPQNWQVWDSSGVWLGTVRTPARFELMRVGSDEVLGARRDDHDVEHPQVLKLVKGSV